MRFPTIFRRRVGKPEPGSKFPDVRHWFEDISPADGLSLRGKLIPELGSDKIPTSKDDLPRRDNLHESRLVNVNGFPSQRIVVGYRGPENAPSLIVDMLLFDETSTSWFKVPPCDGKGHLIPGTLSYFDPPCLLDHSRAKKNPEDESHQAGSLEVILIVRAETPDGTRPGNVEIGPTFKTGIYTFVIGTDVSNPG